MNNLFEKLFGTPGRMVVTLLVAAVVVATVQSVGHSKVAFKINEDYAVAPDAALDLATANARLAGQCYGGKTPRIFLTWPAINGMVQKRTDNGSWTYLNKSQKKTFYADWDIDRYHT